MEHGEFENIGWSVACPTLLFCLACQVFLWQSVKALPVFGLSSIDPTRLKPRSFCYLKYKGITTPQAKCARIYKTVTNIIKPYHRFFTAIPELWILQFQDFVNSLPKYHLQPGFILIFFWPRICENRPVRKCSSISEIERPPDSNISILLAYKVG